MREGFLEGINVLLYNMDSKISYGFLRSGMEKFFNETSKQQFKSYPFMTKLYEYVMHDVVYKYQDLYPLDNNHMDFYNTIKEGPDYLDKSYFDIGAYLYGMHSNIYDNWEYYVPELS